VAITIQATPGHAQANSYATEAEYLARAETRLNLPSSVNTTGTGSLTDTEKKALIEAQRELTTMVWKGTRTTSTQALAWPRQDAPDPDAPGIYGLTDPDDLYFDDTEVPLRVRDAQLELAFEFLRAGTSDLAAADPNTGVAQKTVDILTTRWFEHQRPTGLGRFPRILVLITPLLEGTGLEVVRT
jgi:hypothetical protein